MKRLFSAALLFTLCFSLKAQTSFIPKPIGKDTVYVRDTIVKTDSVAIAMYERFDTSESVFIHRVSRANRPLKLAMASGYVIRRGFIYEEKGKWVWAREPEIVGFLNHKKKKVEKSKVVRIL